MKNNQFVQMGYYLYAIAAAIFVRFIYSRFVKRHRIANQKGKTVWVIGASSGIGKAVAKDYFDNGACVILSSRKAESLEKVRDELLVNHKGREKCIKILPLDIEDIDSFEGKVEEAHEYASAIDIAVISAGLGIRSLAMDTKQEIEDKVMNINYRGPVAFSKAFLRHQTQNIDTSIVYISSVQGLLPVPARASYCAAKHALQGYTDALRAEESNKRTHIMIVSPAYVKTNHSLSAITGDGTPYGKMDATTAKGMEPEELSRRIIIGVDNKQTHLTAAPLWMKSAILMRAFCPNCLDYLLSFKAKKSITPK